MCGVPQGSILGPLLFLVNINDLCSVCEYATPILFADDTNLFCSEKDWETIQMEINTELTKISTWLILSFPETMTSINRILEFQVTSISYQ